MQIAGEQKLRENSVGTRARLKNTLRKRISFAINIYTTRETNKIKTDLTILLHVSIIHHATTNSFAFFLFPFFNKNIVHRMNMPFYNIPSFPFFSSSFYLFLIDFFLLSSISRNETK